MKLNPGTYEGFARGYRGKLYVNVTVSEDRILEVKITKHREYRGIAWGLNTTPMEHFPKLIVEYQSLNIPPVVGADVTSEAILGATAAALMAAGATEDDIAALRLHPCVTVTFGGLETDVSARVMKPDGSIIPHLYAAGEVAGTGMYGTQYPTCGTSIGGALFYGRIAGRVAMDLKML